ncbi:DUF1552 domain-containing protein [Novipirellula sp. SH528]|uniref:DUF1552 domain-containing protein n=1 Tax=Novipirellula sp. SH528 TaxID=3454466 RepID=UPI003FA11A57
MNYDQSRIPRRNFLGGTLALPLLASLGNAAETKKAPKRLVCVGTQLGWYKPDFFASSADARLIKPLDDAGVGDQFTTISGLDHKGPTGNGHALVYTLFTGQVLRSVSLDQLVAAKMGSETRYESLQLCAGEIRNNAAMSLNANGIPLPPIIRPSVMFGKIFGGKAADMKRQQYLLESGRSLLDDVSEDARILRAQVGRQDQDKLDEYLTGVREVEQKLARRRDWLDKPFPVREPGFSLPESEVVAESMLLQNEDLMWDLMALAIKNDSCRVFSLTIPLGGAALLLGDSLMSTSYHGLSHHGNRKNKVDELVAVESAHMKGASRFMKSLSQTRDSDGSTMLDNTTLLIGSAMADASKHRRVDYPLMIAGGGYKHKRHVSCGADQEHKNEMACDLYVTVLQQLGFEADSFASSTSNLNGALL